MQYRGLVKVLGSVQDQVGQTEYHKVELSFLSPLRMRRASKAHQAHNLAHGRIGLVSNEPSLAKEINPIPNLSPNPWKEKNKKKVGEKIQLRVNLVKMVANGKILGFLWLVDKSSSSMHIEKAKIKRCHHWPKKNKRENEKTRVLVLCLIINPWIKIFLPIKG